MSDYIVPTVSPDSDITLSKVVVSPSVVSSCLQSVKNTCFVDYIPAFVLNIVRPSFLLLLVFFFTL